MDIDTTARLAAYLQGELEGEELERLRRELDADAGLRAELQLLQCIREAVREEEPEPASEALLASTLARIRAAERRDPAPERRPGFGARLAAWLAGPSVPRYAFATMATLAVVQFAVIGGLVQERGDEYADTRARPVVPAPAGPFIRVSLRPTATEADVRFLLVSVGASIVGGPTQLGDYYLYVPRERVDAVVRQLRQSRVVDQAEAIATLPEAKE